MGSIILSWITIRNSWIRMSDWNWETSDQLRIRREWESANYHHHHHHHPQQSISEKTHLEKRNKCKTLPSCTLSMMLVNDIRCAFLIAIRWLYMCCKFFKRYISAYAFTYVSIDCKFWRLSPLICSTPKISATNHCISIFSWNYTSSSNTYISFPYTGTKRSISMRKGERKGKKESEKGEENPIIIHTL